MSDGKLTTHDDNNSKYCSRGLEGKTRDGSRQRSRNRTNAACAVLDEQYRQIFEGESDQNSIARVYAKQTSHSRKTALDMASRDEEAASKYLNRESKVPPYNHNYDICKSKKNVTQTINGRELPEEQDRNGRRGVTSPISKVKACKKSINVTPRYSII